MASQVASSSRGRTAANTVEPPDATPSIAAKDSDNCFRILLATDNHIGYAEKDPIRGQDAINTFREILEIARDAEVDFILLAGDLFHENRPSRGCMHQTIALLREYTLGDRPVSFELLSDPMDGSTPGFSFPAINYEDPNLNIAIPTFSIHGNHDDPQGTGPEGALCALDVLSVSGVLNYFGKVDLMADETTAESADKGIRIKPILLRKGSTHLAMYGVGNVKDNRMHYELRSNRVKMFMPEGGDVPEEDWFNMLLVHQNRVKHGPQSSVPEGMFDDSIKLVVWGHEHDCRIWPEKVEGKDYYITQPGSSVATSLAPGEALPKHVGILSIQGSQFQITEIPLKTVRPFEMDEVVLSEAASDESNKINLEDKDSIAVYLRKQVESLIRRAKQNWNERHAEDTEPVDMMLPLIRLKVETSDAKEMTNPVRFGQDFVGRVANPRDILQYYRRKKAAEKKTKNVADAPDGVDDEWGPETDDPNAMTASDRLAKLRMSNLVRQYLQAQQLEVLVENGLEDAVMRFVDKDDRDAIKDFVAETLKSVGKDMKGQEVVEEDVEEHMLRAKEHAASQWAATNHRDEAPKAKKGKAKQDSDVDSMVDDGDSMMEVESDASLKATKKKKGKTASSGSKSRGKKLFAPSASEEEGEEEEEEEEHDEPVPKPTTARSKKTLTPANVRAKPAPKRGAAASKSGGQTQLTFSKTKVSKPIELSDED
ncbi:Mre11 DNA-binding presumed domain-domain-containing protein [Kockovaella imperatae]|uniref:Double-strand break repair protein n=1 Tax=Kockovaella imperatae TaxID=4999 RepID=A0A1Y1UKJ3_9TREE|nr:Mre11 DNA-binding presumed domain-domain-containing protein [Kockovaella imperatae]ORX38057.1 Mre11 DNA-binding presumed domain-domain-containing protein [Kockovaella imperatae]